MNLSELSLNRPVLAMVCSILILVFGAIGYSFGRKRISGY